MTLSPPRLWVNDEFASARYGAEQSALLNRAAFERAAADIRRLPGYAPSRLIALPATAGALGLGGLWCKYEGDRAGVGSFKSLGPPYAMLAVLRGEIGKRLGREVEVEDLLAGHHAALAAAITVVAATSGNHGRALAWAARAVGCRCIIYMSERVSRFRGQAIAALGAEVRRIPGPYDNAVRAATTEAVREGYFVISGVALPDYPDVPRLIMQGYALLAEELIAQLPDGPPTHVFVGAGGGRMAAAICGHFWERYGARRPRLIVVEPHRGDCLFQSAQRNAAGPASASGPTVMDGLVVGMASPLAWTILVRGAFGFLTIDDASAVEALRAMALGTPGDPGLPIGETGIAGMAGLMAAAGDGDLRRALGLDARSRVVAVASEGPTDPELFQTLIQGQHP